MPLYKIKDFDPDYNRHFDDTDILKFDLYNGNDKIGSIDDLLVDDEGRFRYFVINTGAWIFGKKVLLPIGRAQIDYTNRRVMANGLTRQQVENLPEFDSKDIADHDYEERVRGVYRRPAQASLDRTTAVGSGPALEDDAELIAYNQGRYSNYGAATTGTATTSTAATGNTYNYAHDRDLYDLNERDHSNLKLYEERLVASKSRHKAGEVAVGKRVETKQAHVEVPIEKERVVIERVDGADLGTVVTPGAEAFHEGEVARMEVYEEVPDIRKEAFVREEVRVRKETEQDVARADEEIHREQLDVRTDGQAVIDQRNVRNDRK